LWGSYLSLAPPKPVAILLQLMLGYIGTPRTELLQDQYLSPYFKWLAVTRSRITMTESKNLVKVFIYGTLKPGESNYQRYCAKEVVEAERAIAFGQLFTLPLGYPAMVLGNRPIHGFLLSFSSDGILHHLDWLEDYDPKRPIAQNEYNRQQIKTYNLAWASLGLAWVYLMTLEQVYSFGGVLLADGWWSGESINIRSD